MLERVSPLPTPLPCVRSFGETANFKTAQSSRVRDAKTGNISALPTIKYYPHDDFIKGKLH
jgi:hypothetical protein